MTPLLAVIAGLLGAAVGSFGNVMIHRVPRGGSLMRPPSSCPRCGVPVRSRDNVPVLSFLLLRGRCRFCGEPISVRYPLVEAGNAALWVGSVLRFGPSEKAAFVALGSSVLLVLAMIDLEHRRLPNVIVLPATACLGLWVIGVSLADRSWTTAVAAIGGGAALFCVLLLIALISGGMGFGDVKLAAFVGLYAGRFGAGVALAALLTAFIVGGLAAVILLAIGARGRKDAVPFGPALAAGALAAVFVGARPVRAWLGL